MKKLAGIFLLATLVLAACGASDMETNNQDGNRAFASQDYAAAEKAYQQALAANPDGAAPAYNLANVYYRQEDYQQAGNTMQVALRQADEALAAQGYYNVGNGLYNEQEFGAAVDAYKAALRLNPGDIDAKVNLELALRQLQQNQDQQNQDQQNQDQAEPGSDRTRINRTRINRTRINRTRTSRTRINRTRTSRTRISRTRISRTRTSRTRINRVRINRIRISRTRTSRIRSSGKISAQGAGSPGEQPTEPTNEMAQGEVVQVEGLTEEQARQMLMAAAQSTETLQEYLQQVHVFPSGPVEKDW